MYPMAIFWPVVAGEWYSGDFLLVPSLDISDPCRFSWHLCGKDMMLLVDPEESMELEQVHVSFTRSKQARAEHGGTAILVMLRIQPYRYPWVFLSCNRNPSKHAPPSKVGVIATLRDDHPSMNTEF